MNAAESRQWLTDNAATITEVRKWYDLFQDREQLCVLTTWRIKNVDAAESDREVNAVAIDACRDRIAAAEAALGVKGAL